MTMKNLKEVYLLQKFVKSLMQEFRSFGRAELLKAFLLGLHIFLNFVPHSHT